MFHLPRQEVDFFLIADVFELDAHMFGITAGKMRQYLPKGGGAKTDQIASIEVFVEVRV